MLSINFNKIVVNSTSVDFYLYDSLVYTMDIPYFDSRVNQLTIADLTAKLILSK